MIIKLLNIDLIRQVGGCEIEMSYSQGMEYIKQGKGIEVIRKENKSINSPTNNKMVFIAPEVKIFNKNRIINNNETQVIPESQYFDFSEGLFPNIRG
jgi:hypothetical protein